MVNFFIKSGDPEVSKMFTPYLWGATSLGELIDLEVNPINYGDDLELILIKVYVEGQFEIYGPEHLVIENYSRIRKETGAAFTVRRKDFHDKSNEERKFFLAAMVRISIEGIQAKHEKKIRNYNFNLLKANIETATNNYLSIKHGLLATFCLCHSAQHECLLFSRCRPLTLWTLLSPSMRSMPCSRPIAKNPPLIWKGWTMWNCKVRRRPNSNNSSTI